MIKKIVFLGMGGTIAGMAQSAADNVGYTAAQKSVEQLLEAIPTLRLTLGNLDLLTEQVAQVDSKDIAWSHWRALATRAFQHLESPDVASLVITHGTDTLEETAFFLSRVLPPALIARKPVVLTCAMRPASSMSPDGPQNVLDAVAVARSEQAAGVLVVCAGAVHAARTVQKVHPYRLNAFDSGDEGPLGFVEEGVVRWRYTAADLHSPRQAFVMARLNRELWPRVEIVMNFAGASGAVVRALLAQPTAGDQVVRGIVVAGTGNGSVHEDLEAALREADHIGVQVVRSTRCPQGIVVAGSAPAEFRHSEGLSPVKARVALMLDLMQ